MRARSAVPPRGFTLIELMVVVAIIGLLASMAIPSFQGFIIRSKRVERTMMEQQIARDVTAKLGEKGHFPTDLGAGDSYLLASWNPLPPIVGGKKSWAKGQSGWDFIDFEPEGRLYYQYEVIGLQTGGTTTFYVLSTGDLDGDGVQHQRQIQYVQSGDQFVPTVLFDGPATSE